MSSFEETGDFNLYESSSKNSRTFQERNYTKLSNMRVIQKKLVYIIGLSSNLAFREQNLSKFEFFGQYGRITKLVVNRNKIYNMNGPNGPSYSAYVTYSNSEEASLAILSLDNTSLDNHTLKASFGTTKYCSNFLRGSECFNKDCLYLHSLANEEDIIDKDDMTTNKQIFISQHLLAMKIADIFNPEKKSRLVNMRKNKTVLPSPHTIYEKELVISNTPKTKTNPSNKIRTQSRFNFVKSNLSKDEAIEIPSFVSDLITKKFSKLKMTDESQLYYDDTFIKEYSENNPWARYIVSSVNNKEVRIGIESLVENEERKLLNKFKSA